MVLPGFPCFGNFAAIFGSETHIAEVNLDRPLSPTAWALVLEQDLVTTSGI